jgi:hypothetical protein
MHLYKEQAGKNVAASCRGPPASSLCSPETSNPSDANLELSLGLVIRNTPLMNFTKNIGMLLLAIYLILVGLVTLLGLGVGYIAGIIALLAGIFILIGK